MVNKAATLKRSNQNLIECFTTLLLFCEVVTDKDQPKQSSSPEQHGRSTLISSTRRLGVVVHEAHAANDVEGGFLKGNANEGELSLLLKIEQAVESFRRTCNQFVQFARENGEEIRELLMELEDLKVDSSQLQFPLLARSLARTYQTKIVEEKRAIQTLLHSIDTQLYSSLSNEDLPEQQSILKQINRLEKLLNRKLIPESSLQFSVILSLVNALVNGTSDSNRGVLQTTSSGTDPELDGISDTNEETEIAMKHVDLPSPPWLFQSFQSIFQLLLCFEETPASSVKTFCGVHKVLLVGNEGYGKTYTCNRIQNDLRCDTRVVRPVLATLQGSTVGAMEDMLISLFHYCTKRSKEDDFQRTVLILDDIGHLLDGGSGGNGMNLQSGSDGQQSHLSMRTKSVFLSMLDTAATFAECPLLIICTSNVDVNRDILRFHRVFHLRTPTLSERKEAISSFLDVDLQEAEKHDCISEFNQLLLDVTESTTGSSYAELAQNCRDAISDVATNRDNLPRNQQTFDDKLLILRSLRDKLLSLTPASLRNGVQDDFVDMRLLSGKDLLGSGTASSHQAHECPLFGSEASAAWKELEKIIILPLCRSKELNALLNGGVTDSNAGASGMVCGGVLLTGPPGCGKTMLAHRCAAFAASLLPTVKLLEVSCTSLIHKEVGASEKAVHRLFECARAAAPCILLLDDIADIATVRGNDNTTEGTMDRVLSTLLTEMDGIDNQADQAAGGLSVIGITQEVSRVDAALRRPGRLQKSIYLGMPDETTRRDIIKSEIKWPTLALGNHAVDDLENEMSKLSDYAAKHSSRLSPAEIVSKCRDARIACMQKMQGVEVFGEVDRTLVSFYFERIEEDFSS